MTGAFPSLVESAEFSRRAVTLGFGAAFALATTGARAAKGLSGFHDVRQYGARGDGRTIDSPAINRAIEAASRAGGGTVVIPPGRYLCFSIRLKDRITLLLAAGSVIEAADPDVHGKHYDLPEGAFEEQFNDFGLVHYHNSLIYGVGIRDAAIIGKGLIHGIGLEREGPGPRWHGVPGWKSPKELGLTPEAARLAIPEEREQEGRANKSIGLKECRNIVIRDISILQGGHFSIYALGCGNLTIDNVTIDTDRDGIDIDCCRDVRVSDCIVNSPKDDAIVLKSTYGLDRKQFCEDVVVTGCKTSGYLLGSVLDGSYQKSPYRSPDNVGVLGRIKLGTDSVAAFRNILISDCQCENSRGLQLGSIDGGVLEDVTFSNITMRNIVNHPIFVRLAARLRAPSGTEIGSVRRVRFSDINVSGAEGRFACGVVGVPGSAIEDVSFTNVHVSSTGGGTVDDAERDPPERRNSSLEPSFMGSFPAHGLYVRHARNIALRGVTFAVERPDARPAVIFDDVDGAQVAGLRSPAEPARAIRSLRSRGIVVGEVQRLA